MSSNDDKATDGPKRHFLLRAKVVRDIFIPLNAYASGGHLGSAFRLATGKQWREKYGIRAAISLLLAIATFTFNFSNPNAPSPAELITTIFPNLLGFSIGAYAVLFSMPEILGLLGGKKRRSSLANADMAMPLTMMALSIFVGVITKSFGNPSPLNFFCWFFLFYVLLLLFELIVLIFAAANRIALKNDYPE